MSLPSQANFIITKKSVAETTLFYVTIPSSPSSASILTV